MTTPSHEWELCDNASFPLHSKEILQHSHFIHSARKFSLWICLFRFGAHFLSFNCWQLFVKQHEMRNRCTIHFLLARTHQHSIALSEKWLRVPDILLSSHFIMPLSNHLSSNSNKVTYFDKFKYFINKYIISRWFSPFRSLIFFLILSLSFVLSSSITCSSIFACAYTVDYLSIQKWYTCFANIFHSNVNVAHTLEWNFFVCVCVSAVTVASAMIAITVWLCLSILNELLLVYCSLKLSF